MARQTVGTLAGVARASYQFGQRAIGLCRDERRQGVEMRFEHGASTVTLHARRHLTRLAPPCFNSRTHDPLHCGTSPRHRARPSSRHRLSGVIARSRQGSIEYARIEYLLHRCTQEYHLSAQRVQGLSSKSAY